MIAHGIKSIGRCMLFKPVTKVFLSKYQIIIAKNNNIRLQFILGIFKAYVIPF